MSDNEGEETQPREVSQAAAAAANTARRARRIAGRAPAAAQTGSATPSEREPSGVRPRDEKAVSLEKSTADHVPTQADTDLATDVPDAVPAHPSRTASGTAGTTTVRSASGGTSAARWLPAALLGLAALTMAVLVAAFSHSVWWGKPAAHPGQGNKLREQVLSAAKACTVATNKYSYKTLKADEAAAVRCTVGVQATRYKSVMKRLIEPNAIKLKASQVPQINEAGIEAITDDGKQWSVLIYGQLAINTTTNGKRIDPFAAVVRMDYVKGKWLMSSIQPLDEPNG